jgi:hypothetical protein
MSSDPDSHALTEADLVLSHPAVANMGLAGWQILISKGDRPLVTAIYEDVRGRRFGHGFRVSGSIDEKAGTISAVVHSLDKKV